MTKLYAEITKTEPQDDGTIRVWGYASSEAVDCDGEVITADAMKAAIPDYMRFGAVREMHDPKKAAGTAIDISVQDDGRTLFGAHVVDPVAVKKVQTGVYKGFSIGGRVPKDGRVKKSDGVVEITSLQLSEVSLVDRPANPEAVFTCFKADGAAPGEKDGETDEAAEKADETAERPGQEPAEVPPVEKAGRRFSAATKQALKSAHEACKAADKALADLKYDADDEAAEEAAGGDKDNEAAEGEKKADDGGDVQKAAVADDAAREVAEIFKAAGIASADPLDMLRALAKRATDLHTELEALKKQPAPPKGVARVIAKAEDVAGAPITEPAPVTKADGSTDDVATLIKVAQSRPIRIVG